MDGRFRHYKSGRGGGCWKLIRLNLSSKVYSFFFFFFFLGQAQNRSSFIGMVSKCHDFEAPDAQKVELPPREISAKRKIKQRLLFGYIV